MSTTQDDRDKRFMFAAAHISDLATVHPDHIPVVMQQLPYIVERLRLAAAVNKRDGLGPLEHTLPEVSFVQGITPPGKSTALQDAMASIACSRNPLATSLPRRLARMTDLHTLNDVEALMLARNLPVLVDAMRRIKAAMGPDVRICDAIPFISIDSQGFQVARNLHPAQTFRAAAGSPSPSRRRA